MGMAAGDALYLTQVGTDSLWLVFVSTPILMALVTPGYTRWMERRGINRLAEGVLWVLAAVALKLPEAPALARRLVLEAPARLLRKAARLALVDLAESSTPISTRTIHPSGQWTSCRRTP